MHIKLHGRVVQRHGLLHAVLHQLAELIRLAGLAFDHMKGGRCFRQAKRLAVDLAAQVPASAANARLLLADFAADQAKQIEEPFFLDVATLENPTLAPVNLFWNGRAPKGKPDGAVTFNPDLAGRDAYRFPIVTLGFQRVLDGALG